MRIKKLFELCKDQLLSGTSAKNGITSILIYCARLVLQLATGVVLARLMSPSNLGVYVFVFAVVSMGAIGAQFGMTTLLVREGAAARATRDARKLATLFKLAIKTTIVGTLIVVTALLLAVWWLGKTIPFLNPTIAIFGLALIPLMVAASLGEAALEGLGKPIHGAFPGQILRSILFLGSLVLFFMIGVTLIPINAIWLQIFSHFSAAAVVIWLWRRETSQQLMEVPAAKVSSDTDERSWLKSSASFLLIHGMWVVLSNTDLIMLGVMLDAEQVGFYRVASTAAAMSFLGMQALRPIVNERMSWHHTKDDKVELQRFAKFGVTGALSVALPLLIVFSLWGEGIIALLFGPAYAAAFSTLVILTTGQTLHIAVGYAPSLLAMTGYERVNLIVLSATAVLNIALNLALIPHFGSTGAALATSVSITTQALAMWSWAHRKTGIDTSIIAWFHTTPSPVLRKRK